ncbi:MAG: metallophosphoesterase N-terminal domain-containing protein, partial [Planctomycetota bacterium]|nr:metallophosphoesterase N-terminal domain-containing protein [Planctomycetota bacterium]
MRLSKTRRWFVCGLLFGLSIHMAGAKWAFADALKLLLKETPKPNYRAPVPAQISGGVFVRAKGKTWGAKGVSVTDGYSVVKTDGKGAYTLTPDASAVFVYITRPSGYDIEGDWYKPLSAKVDFALKPAASDEDDYFFVHVTDTHVSENRRSVEGLSR